MLSECEHFDLLGIVLEELCYHGCDAMCIMHASSDALMNLCVNNKHNKLVAVKKEVCHHLRPVLIYLGYCQTCISKDLGSAPRLLVASALMSNWVSAF